MQPYVSIATILVVEDEKLVRNLIVRVLIRGNYRVLEAASAAEAIEVSEHFEGIIDLMVADHSLKGMSGREVAETIRDARPDIKILQISGYPKERLARQGDLVRDAYFLPKPFSNEDFVEKVTRILDEARPEHQSASSGC